MASTNPLTDALSQLVARANGVANDPEVRSSVRRLGSDLKGLGGAVVGGWRSATTHRPTTEHAAPVPPPPPAHEPYAREQYAPGATSTAQPTAEQPPTVQPGEPYPPR